MNKFGEFLYELRKSKGLTQQELADKLDITNKAVSKWETGEAFPETAQLVPLSRILGVSVDELLNGERDRTKTTDNSENMRPVIKPFTTGEALLTSLAIGMMIMGVLFVIMWELKGLLYLFISVSLSIFILCLMGMRRKLRSIDLDPQVYKKGLTIALLISVGVAIIILSPIAIITMNNMIIFFITVIVALSFLITGGTMWSSFDNTYKLPVDKDEPRSNKAIALSETLCGVIMLLATAFFLIMGLGFNRWHPGWVAFPIGGILCGVVSTLVKGFIDKK